MNEWNYMILMPVSSLLFMLGGYHWKWMRRYLLPAIFLGFMILNNIFWLNAVGCFGGLIIVFCLPYGDSIKKWSGDGLWLWVARFFIGCLYILPTLIIGFTIWQCIFPIVFVSMFWLSNQKWSEHEFQWKIVEGSIGFLLGIIIARLIT